MEGVVQVISREIVKPSSQIHPKKLKLSYLDQIIPRIYIPIIFFYEADESKGLTTSNHAQISKQLKRSLSDTLTTFYPLAGRVEAEDDAVVNCNDAGVEFIEARLDARLDVKGTYLEDYKLEQYYYLPEGPPTREWSFLFVQITFFGCGGMALGVCFSHLLADCHSVMMFINSWASACKSAEIPQKVSFDLADYFPARHPLHVAPLNTSKFPVIRTKNLLFDKEKIALLKQVAISTTVKDPTKVEVISAFIWKFMLGNCAAIDTKSRFAAMLPVNLRGRKSHLENVFGNCVMTTTACADDGEVEFHALVTKLRSSIRKIDEDYIREAQYGDNFLNDAYKTDVCVFSSWCRFPFYQVDYGFGTPILFCPAIAAYNCTHLVSSKTGGNIEAWVTMEQHIIDMLENQINLIPSTVN